MPTPLPLESFLAIASVVHADGVVRKPERDSLKAAALAYGLSEDEVSALLSRADSGLPLCDIEFPEMSTWQKALTYSFAVWVAKADGIINLEELVLLRKLGDTLELEKLRRDAARAATYDIAALPGGHRPDRYDFAALEQKLEEKLPASFREHQSTNPQPA